MLVILQTVFIEIICFGKILYFCFMRLIFVILSFLLFLRFASFAQSNESNWSLQKCVQYAIEHNISIRQDSLSAQSAKNTLLQSRLAQLPSVSANTGYGRSFGRSVNPTTNQFVDGSYNYISASGSVNVLLFAWMQTRNTIEKNQYNLQASLADLDQLKDDVSLNVATGFLTALLAKEQIHITENQITLSKAQLDQTKAFADAGRLPELNVAQLESQLASDSSNLINAMANYNSAVLDLKTLLNLDLSTHFAIQLPEVEPTGLLVVSNLQPEDIYIAARSHFGSIKGSEYRVAATEKGLKVAKSGLYPQLSLSGQLGTNWASNYETYKYSNQISSYQPIGFVSNTGDTVLQPIYKVNSSIMPFGNQMNNNFRQTLSINLGIPIFSGWQAQYVVKQAKISYESQQLSKYNAEITLKQNVYKAHNNALNSIQKYYAAKRADDAAKRALDFAKKRYDLGLTSTVDFLVTQNSAFVASSNLIIAKYDLVFKLKVIDYYLGKELKL